MRSRSGPGPAAAVTLRGHEGARGGCKLKMVRTGLGFVVSVGFYGFVAATTLVWSERRHPKSALWRAKILDWTIDVTNFANAVTATVLSSWVLATMDAEERTNPRGKVPNDLASWTVESVCGYVVVEIMLLFVARFRLPRRLWDMAVNSLRMMVTFHIVALLGLVSVVVFDSGYPLAIWGIWSEMTSIFLGLESFFEGRGVDRSLYFMLRVCSAVIFIFQRVIVFFYLLWLCLIRFSWELTFVVQVCVLVVGTALNVIQGAQQVIDLKNVI